MVLIIMYTKTYIAYEYKISNTEAGYNGTLKQVTTEQVVQKKININDFTLSQDSNVVTTFQHSVVPLKYFFVKNVHVFPLLLFFLAEHAHRMYVMMNGSYSWYTTFLLVS